MSSAPPVIPAPPVVPQPLPTQQAADQVRAAMAGGLSLGEAVEKFAKEQPRVPPGRPEGGQWTTPADAAGSPPGAELPEAAETQPPAEVAKPGDTPPAEAKPAEGV